MNLIKPSNYNNTNSEKSFTQDSSNLDLPKSYGGNRIVLFARDPWVLFSYWEIDGEIEKSVRENIKKKNLNAEKKVLRIYEAKGSVQSPKMKVICDFELREWATSWYIHAGGPGKDWVVDIGILCDNGDFFCLARSNTVRTPRHEMSDICDEAWMCPEELYYKFLFNFGNGNIGYSSFDIRDEAKIKKTNVVS